MCKCLIASCLPNTNIIRHNNYTFGTAVMITPCQAVVATKQ